jgi:hypothetical protein
MKEDYALTVGSAWTSVTQGVFNEICKEILDDLCLKHYDHWKLLVLCTDFSVDAFGYVMLLCNRVMMRHPTPPCTLA